MKEGSQQSAVQDEHVGESDVRRQLELEASTSARQVETAGVCPKPIKFDECERECPSSIDVSSSNQLAAQGGLCEARHGGSRLSRMLRAASARQARGRTARPRFVPRPARPAHTLPLLHALAYLGLIWRAACPSVGLSGSYLEGTLHDAR